MANLRLRDSMSRAGYSTAALAELLDVDPKTVERWVSTSRAPHPRSRSRIAAELRERESWLWPNAVSAAGSVEVAKSELVELYPHRYNVPTETWPDLFEGASTFIDVLAYAALFLPEQNPVVVDTLKRNASAGVRVRLLMGDPTGQAVVRRGLEEGIGDAVAIKTANALRLFRRALGTKSGVQLRVHDTTLYTSVYRADDAMIANPHVHGLPAAQSPVIHLRRIGPGGLFDTYEAMYDRIWDEAAPAIS